MLPYCVYEVQKEEDENKLQSDTYVCIYVRGMQSGLTGLAEAGNALLQKLQRQMGLVGSQSLTDGDYEKSVVGGNAEAGGLQQLTLYL